jgi:hypothetical protein
MTDDADDAPSSEWRPSAASTLVLLAFSIVVVYLFLPVLY